MTCALIAAHLGHYGDNMIAKVPSEGGLRVLNVNGGGCRLAFSSGSDYGVSIGNRLHRAGLIDGDDGGIGGGPLGSARPIFLMIGDGGFGKKLVAGFRAVERDGFWEQRESLSAQGREGERPSEQQTGFGHWRS